LRPMYAAVEACIYPKAVFPTPGGPNISVTLPRMYPPDTLRPGGPAGASMLSSCVRPVGTARAPWAWSVWRACEADTVGRRSIAGSDIVQPAMYGVVPLRTRRCGRRGQLGAIVAGHGGKLCVQRGSNRVIELNLVTWRVCRGLNHRGTRARRPSWRTVSWRTYRVCCCELEYLACNDGTPPSEDAPMTRSIVTSHGHAVVS
jgi:hypothetical protein